MQMKFSGRAAWPAIVAAAWLSAGVAYAGEVANGDTGVLYVRGELTRGTCSIDTSSRWQTIVMGSMTDGMLLHSGDQAAGKVFHVHLRECIASGNEEARRQTGTVVRVADQPEVRISFGGTLDADNPQLFAVEGASGFGLRLEDASHHLVSAGGMGEPLVLEPGSDELTFWLYPERTRAPLREGSWSSVLSMRLSYE